MSEAAWAGPIGPGGEVGGFVVEAVAGRGGMGVVYRARQRKPDRVVALKVIATELAADPAFRARFERESTIAAQIEHPNVIPVHAVGEDRGILFIAMRFVAGIDLRTLIVQEGRLDPRRAAAIVDQAAQALDAAHRRGLVHRDVKPANMLLATASGRDHVYLTDFGLSRHVEGSQGLTGTGAFLGTIDYVAPEQARAERVDARTDVYSLGCVLFHALTGTVPFPLTNELAKLYAHGTQAPPSVRERAPGVPAAFEVVVMRALAKAPDDRYLSAGDLGRAALLAADDAVGTRAETNVAVGAAAPAGVAAVPARPRPPEDSTLTARRAPPPPRAPTRRGRAIATATAALVVVAAIAALALGGGGGSGKRAADVGLVRGRSIGPVALGELPADAQRTLVAAGYAPRQMGQYETDFSSPTLGTYVVQYYVGGRITQIHKYNDTSITVNGVAVTTTLRAARAKLPDWYLVRCVASGRSLLAAPAGHTYLELPLAPDQPDADQANGIVVSVPPVDQSFCG